MGRALWLLSGLALLGLNDCKKSEEHPAANAGSPSSGGAAGEQGMGSPSGGAGSGGSAGATGASSGGSSGGTAGTGMAGMSTAAAAGCGSESFAAIYQSIISNPTYNCSGPLCHGRDPSMAASVGNLSMPSAAMAYGQLVGKTSDSTMCSGKTRVVPGDPASSLLVQKLRDTTTRCGAPMPVNADPVTDPELKRITDWISGGACNN